MGDMGVDVVIERRLAGIAMADHIDGVDMEMFGVRLDVAHIGFEMAAGAVQQQQRVVLVVSRLETAGWHAGGVDPADAVFDIGNFRPQRHR
jgi:hypothetical protein